MWFPLPHCYVFFFFNDTATTEIYTLSLHDALPIYNIGQRRNAEQPSASIWRRRFPAVDCVRQCRQSATGNRRDRKSTRLNSSHQIISYAVFCLKKKKHESECSQIKASIRSLRPCSH